MLQASNVHIYNGGFFFSKRNLEQMVFFTLSIDQSKIILACMLMGSFMGSNFRMSWIQATLDLTQEFPLNIFILDS